MYHGAEFTSHAMLRWAAEHDVELHFIAPGKPTQNGNIESLNGKIRDELFNMHRFTTIFEARRRADEWKTDYNEVRPHSAPGYQTPKEFAEAFKINPTSQLSAARKATSGHRPPDLPSLTNTCHAPNARDFKRSRALELWGTGEKSKQLVAKNPSASSWLTQPEWIALRKRCYIPTTPKEGAVPK
jgi:hypothetical protein